MKLTILLITALAGISVAAPAEVPASSNVEVKARQHTQPGQYFNMYIQWEDRSSTDSKVTGPCDWVSPAYH